jgi:hypothetical protein
MLAVPTTECLQNDRGHDQSAGFLPDFRADPTVDEAINPDVSNYLSNHTRIQI